MKTFKEYLKDIEETTTTADIATVDTKLSMTKKCTGKEDCCCEVCKPKKE